MHFSLCTSLRRVLFTTAVMLAGTVACTPEAADVVSETEDEVTNCLEAHGVRPAELLDRVGMLGPQTVLAHGCWLDRAELELGPGDQRVPDRVVVLAGDGHAARLERERVERRADRALDRVLPGHPRAVRPARVNR